MTVTAAAFAGLDALPPGCEALFAAAARRSFQLTPAWFGAVLAAAMPADARPLFLLCHAAGRPLVLFPLRTRRQGRQLEGLSTPYTCLYQPLAAADATPAELRAAGAAFGRFCRSWGAVRLDALDPDWPGLAPLLRGAREAGLLTLPFRHFGNWHESVAGRSWATYLAARPGALRETIRRRLRQAERDPAIRLETIEAPAGLEAGIAAYEAVYAASWKPPEPFPGFSAALLRAAAPAGVLRLGILRRDGRPVAAQVLDRRRRHRHRAQAGA